MRLQSKKMKRINPHGFKRILVTLLSLLIILVYLWMARLPDLRLVVPEWTGISAAIMVMLILMVYCSGRSGKQWSATFILCIALMIRVMFLHRPPELSDDIYRYVLDGLQLLSGHNPYAATPAELLTKHPSLAGIIGRVNHGHLPTIYPPAAQLVFAMGVAMGGILGIKILFVLMDMCTCAIILRLLKKFRRQRNLAVLYAWHPLPVMEIAGSGHIDGALIGFLFASIWLLLTGQPEISHGNSPLTRHRTIHRPIIAGTAGILFSAAVMTKWIPLIFAPGILMLADTRTIRFGLCGFMISAVVMFAAFWPDVQNCFHSLNMYVQHWEFSEFAFRHLRNLTGSGEVTRYLLAITFMVICGVIYIRSRKGNRFNISPKFQAVGRDLKYQHQKAFSACYAVTMAFLFFTPTLHPWYALYLVAFLPFNPGASGIILSWAVLLAYRVEIRYAVTGQWIENDLVPFLIVSGPLVVWIGRSLLRIFDSKNLGQDLFQRPVNR